MDNTQQINIKGLVFNIRTEKTGDMNVINEVVEGDCYDLQKLSFFGYKPDQIIDIGAHLGSFSVFAHSLFPDVPITSFEPNKRSFELLTANTAHIPNITLVNAAVHSGEDLILTDGEGATGGGFVSTRDNWQQMSEGKTAEDHFEYSVFDDLMKSVLVNPYITGDSVLLKIDCEGSEFDIFKNLTSDLAAKVSRIVGEYHLFGQDGGDTTLEGFQRLVAETFPHLELRLRRIANIELFSCRKKP